MPPDSVILELLIGEPDSADLSTDVPDSMGTFKAVSMTGSGVIACRRSGTVVFGDFRNTTNFQVGGIMTQSLKHIEEIE